jgi:signal transduction histidine kinase/putative methionine-R-sulfoxide reductase with GAF domain
MVEAMALATSTADLSELLQDLLEQGVRAVNGNRGFVALVDFDSGQLVIQCVAGEGWNDEIKLRRLELHTGEGTGITTYVAATGKPYRTGDVDHDPYYLPYFSDVRSEIAVPILDAQGRTRGVINVESPSNDAFDEWHQECLRVIANVASAGITIDGHRSRERAFVEIGTELAASRDIASLVAKVIKVAAEVLRFEDCSLFLLDADRQTLTLQASRGRLNEKAGSATYKLGEGLTGWIAEHGLPIRTTDPQHDPRWRGLHQEYSADEMGAYLGVPIEGRQGIIGVLRVLRRRSKFLWFRNEFTADDEGVLTSIASQVGAAVQSLRLMDRVVNAERMAAWGEMSARSAHMIGNRVFAIKGDLNELEYGLCQPEDTREQLKELAESIKNGVFRLEEILMEFRDFVMATSLSLGEYDINEVVSQAVEESFPKRCPVRLEVNLASDLPHVMADSAKLKRSFAELIENAISFQEDGGILRVSTSRAERKEARTLCGLSGKQDYVRIEFADAGPGVPQGNKEKIFTPFFTSRAKGMGLGLSIVKGIVEAHRGGICECGEEGSGARFVILLPAA